MSVSSLGSSLSSAMGYGISKLTAAAQATIEAASAEEARKSSGGVSNSLSISNAAKIAAAEQADNAKDFTTLSQDVRKTLDAQYAAAKANKTDPEADLSLMSGRALAAIALNKTGAFSRTETLAAKRELNDRARAELTEALKSGNAMDALVAYNQQLVTDYDGMTQEERDARGWTADTRATAQSFVTTVNGTATTPSLFALLESDG